jgi:hypothetical protein
MPQLCINALRARLLAVLFIRVISGSRTKLSFTEKDLHIRIPSLPHGFRGFPWLLPQDKPQMAQMNTDCEPSVRR